MLAQLVPQLLKITKDLIRNENNDSFLLLKELLFYIYKKVTLPGEKHLERIS